MRLFEVDQAAVRSILAVLRGQANQANQTSQIPFAAIQQALDGSGITAKNLRTATIGNPDPAAAQQFKDLITRIDDNGMIYLNTDMQDPDAKDPNVPTPTRSGGGGPSVDSMASHNAKTAIK